MEDLDLQQAINHLRFALERSGNQTLIDDCGWGSSHFRLLTTIAHSHDVTQAAIAHELGQTEAAVSRQLKLLIDKQLVIQTPNPNNRRQNQLSLTSHGHAELIKAKALMKRHLKQLFANLDPETINQTIRLLNQITEKIEQNNPNEEKK